MQDRPTERVRVLLDGLTASAIVDRVHPYYSGYQFEGEWLDTLKESIEGELDEVDAKVRPYERYTCHDTCAGVAEFACSACGFHCDVMSWISLFDGDEGRHRHHHHGTPNYCPNCGRRVVEGRAES